MTLRINKILEEKNISVAELGRRLDKSRATMHATLEKGNPQYSTLLEIAKALNVDITDLFETEKNNKQLNALIDHRGKLYKASSIKELENIIDEIKKSDD